MEKENALTFFLVGLVGLFSIGLMINESITGGFTLVASSGPQTPTAQEQWALKLIDVYATSMAKNPTPASLNYCKNNCFMVLMGNCNSQKIASQPECGSLAAKFNDGCKSACDIKFAQAQRSTQQQTSAQKPTPASSQQIQYSNCASTCATSRAQTYTQCFAQQPATKSQQEKISTCSNIINQLYANCMNGCIKMYSGIVRTS